MKKILKSIIILSAFMLMLASCASGESKAMDYITDKYGESFEYLEKDYDSNTIRCYSSWMDPKYEYVTIFIHKDGTFGDNYFEFLKRDDFEKELQQTLMPVLGYDAKVFMGNTNTEIPESLNTDSNIEDLYSEIPTYTLCADIFTAQPINKEYIEQTLKATGHSYMINVFSISEEAYNSVTRYDNTVLKTYNKTCRPDGITIKDMQEISVFQ